MSRSDNAKGTRITPQEEGLIAVRRFALGQSYRQIADAMGRGKSGVHDCAKRLEQQDPDMVASIRAAVTASSLRIAAKAGEQLEEELDAQSGPEHVGKRSMTNLNIIAGTSLDKAATYAGISAKVEVSHRTAHTEEMLRVLSSPVPGRVRRASIFVEEDTAPPDEAGGGQTLRGGKSISE